MKGQIDERKLITDTINDLQDGLTELDQKREMLEWEISQKQERLQIWQAKLGVLTGSPVMEPRKRAPRGANLKTILSLLQDPASPRQGRMTSEIVAKTNLSFSSVQIALKQGVDAGHLEQVDNFWRPKLESKPADPPTPEAAAKNGGVVKVVDLRN